MSATARFLAAMVLVVATVFAILSSPVVAPIEAQGVAQTKYPTSYNYVVTFLDFFDTDRSANISFSLSGQFALPSGGVPDRLGLNLEDPHTGNHTHVEANGSCIYQDCSAAAWSFDFSVRSRGLGAGDFYPYDSYLFNFTLETPLLFLANKTNTHQSVYVSAYGWEAKFVPTPPLVEGYWGKIVTTVVLQRASWTVTPVRLIPVFLFLILGLTAFIPSGNLSSKITVCTAVIFFIAASIFNLGAKLPPRVYGLSFAETVFYYLLLISSAYLVESILENRIFSHSHRRTRSVISLVFMQIAFVGLAIDWIYLYTYSFQTLTVIYWWSGLDQLETRIGPMILVALGTIFNIIITRAERRRVVGKRWMGTLPSATRQPPTRRQVRRRPERN